MLAQLVQHFVNHFLCIPSTNQPSSRICASPGHLGFFFLAHFLFFLGKIQWFFCHCPCATKEELAGSCSALLCAVSEVMLEAYREV